MKELYWIWLQSALGFGSKYLLPLIERFGDAEHIFNATKDELNGVQISPQLRKKLLSKSLSSSEKILRECQENGISVISFASADFPDTLKQISTPPAVLYAKGDISLLGEETAICIVGPRHVSVYGKKAAFSLAARLSLCGFTVVSGGAIGCDSAAHSGVLSVGGKTVCFLGAGICSDYLKQNIKLRKEILKNGLLVTEYPPYYSASKYTFPVRNRLMAAFCLGTVVIEAADKSGALITANAAAEAGKDVFVIPGTPTSPEYMGSNKLLRDGAKPLLELSDIIVEYLPLYPHKITPEKAYSRKLSMKTEEKTEKVVEKPKEVKKIVKKSQENLSKNAKIVYNQLDKPIFYLDELNRSELTNSEILAAITELELFEFIKALPGGKFGITE